MNLSQFSGQETQYAAPPTNTQSLSDAEVEQIRQLLMKGNRQNVFPNKFDRNKPFRVSLNYDGRWNNYGTFGNIEVATAVAAVVVIAHFGKAATTGVFNAKLAESHPEWIEWYARNQDMVAQASARQEHG